jgi:hypothetical protein
MNIYKTKLTFTEFPTKAMEKEEVIKIIGNSDGFDEKEQEFNSMIDSSLVE